jgi:hypothetical protein
MKQAYSDKKLHTATWEGVWLLLGVRGINGCIPNSCSHSNESDTDRGVDLRMETSPGICHAL